jgi:Phospholipase_D-nuclease N-terminal
MLSNVPDTEGLAASVMLIAILLGVLLLVGFDLFCLVHLATADRVRLLPKLAWAVAVVCISPFGGLVYLLSQRQPKAIAGFLSAVRRACLIRCADTLRLVANR